MAFVSHSGDNSEKLISWQETHDGKVFIPKDTLDQPCDVILVAQDGQFKAHRQVLSEASPFFEKLLNNDMKELKEGVIRLEMFTESVISNTLEFIYTGNVQILDEDDARDLVVIADYLFLQNLKTLAAQVLQQKLNTSNCISIFRFADEYRCEELVSKTKTFILKNFPVVFTFNQEDVMKMPNKELAMWISSDELHISAEEEVFNIILAWINHDNKERKKYFAELFRHVRLVYISRDYLGSNIVTNDLVKNNEGCLDLVTEAMKSIASERFDNLQDKPRKILETSVLLTYRGSTGKYIMCYFPCEDRWYTLGKRPRELIKNYQLFFCNGKLYSSKIETLVWLPYHKSWRLHVTCYNPHSNAWKSLPSLENRHLLHLFLYKDEMHALFSKSVWGMPSGSRWEFRPFDDEVCCACGYHEEAIAKHDFLITKYIAKSNSWQDILSLTDYLDWRRDSCIVAQENFVYFIGGRTWVDYKLTNDVDRFDLSRNQWDKLADIQVARAKAHGAAASGKIFIAGGVRSGRSHLAGPDYECEMYNETTNEWQFVKSFSIKPGAFRGLVAVDDELYVLGETHEWRDGKYFESLTVKCYHADSDSWNLKTELTTTSKRMNSYLHDVIGGSLKVFQGFLSPSHNTFSHKRDKRKCSIM